MLRPTSGRRPDTTAFSITAIVVVVAFGFVLSKTHGVVHLDLQGVKALNRLHTGALGTLGATVYKVFSPAEAIILTVVIVAVIWAVSRNLRLAATFAVTVAVTWLSSDIVKLLVHRARPDRSAFAHHITEHPTDPSFPSGHMVFVATLAMAFVFLTRDKPYRGWVVAAGIVAVLVVAFSLISDGVHYPSDVTASVVWSVGVAPLVLGLWNRYVLPLTYRTPSSVEAPA
ncbi:phosphatase PAP2 family protein [Frondihabitans cladoniiphilus]|uniref:Phosphatase PAP2 family protein n=2 Tax=Frondihabitans cladoniiphilus TaxID=715785 RepID=A0ABP8VHS0_9MICO